MVPEFLLPWFAGHGLLLAALIGRRVFADITGL